MSLALSRLTEDWLRDWGLKRHNCLAGLWRGDTRVVMLGLDGTGKTTSLYFLKQGEIITTTSTTCGFNIECVKFNHPSLGNTYFNAWDVGSSGRIRHLWRHYLDGALGLVFFVDSSDHNRAQEACDELQRLLRGEYFELMDSIPVLVFANKQDVSGSMSVEAVERVMRLHLIRDREWNCMPAVANTGEGLWAGMLWLYDAMHRWSRSPAAYNYQPGRDKPQVSQEEEEPLLAQWLTVDDVPDDQFMQSLEEGTAATVWDHRTRVRMAWLYLSHHPWREGLQRIFATTRALMDRTTTTNTNTNTTTIGCTTCGASSSPAAAAAAGGATSTVFHATLTHTWAHIVHFAIESTENTTGTFNQFIVMNPHLSNLDLPLRYFSQQLLDSAGARDEVVLPDLRPLPSIITNIRPLAVRARSQRSKVTRPPSDPRPTLSDVEFLSAVRDRTLPGWGHEAMLRTLWTCMRLHGARRGVDYAVHVLRSFQGSGFHYTLTYYWCQVLGQVMAYGWAAAVARLDEAEEAREAAWQAKQATCCKGGDEVKIKVASSDLTLEEEHPRLLTQRVMDERDRLETLTSTGVQGGPWTSTATNTLEAHALESEQAFNTLQGYDGPAAADGQALVRSEFLLVSAQPAASALIPSFPALLSGEGYASDRARRVLHDTHRYLHTYTSQRIHTDQAARTLVLPDKQQPPDLMDYLDWAWHGMAGS